MSNKPVPRPPAIHLLLIAAGSQDGTVEQRLADAGFSLRICADLAHAAALDSLPGEVVLLTRAHDDRAQLDAIHHHRGRLRILCFGAAATLTERAALLRAGSRGLVDIREDREQFLAAITAVSQGQLWFCRATFTAVLDELLLQNTPSTPAPLTPRERQIVRHVALAESNKEIASALGVTESTVKNHLQSIFDKLRVDSRQSLAGMPTALPEASGMPSGRRRG